MIVIPHVVCILQAELNVKESQIADLQDNIKSQQFETSKAKSELTTALEEMEKLKKDCKADRTSWETEKTSLLKRAEEAEATHKPVTEELSGLKGQINNMTAAIFGKTRMHFNICFDITLNRLALHLFYPTHHL